MLRKLYPDPAIRITADERTNSVLVKGNKATLAEIEAILLRQDEAKPSKSEGARQSKTRTPAHRMRPSGNGF